MPACNHQFYENVDTEFYEKTCKKSSNIIRSWFHNQRHNTLRKWASKNYIPGQVIVDLACGTCTWNKDKLPVIGVDISQNMLNYAKNKGRLVKTIKSDVTNTKLKNNSADIIIITEVLEHLPNYMAALKEAHRILKPNGKLFISVPYDTLFSLWAPLFNGYCIIKGFIFGSKHHRVFAGHVIHFSPKKIRKAIIHSGFKMIKQFNIKRFTIYNIAEKN